MCDVECVMSHVEFVISRVRCRCQISGGVLVGGGGVGQGRVSLNFSKLLKVLIIKFLEIASVNC